MQRTPRYTNLPGSVGSSVIVAPSTPRRRPRQRVLSPLSMKTTTTMPSIAESRPVVRPPVVEAAAEDHHVVFATVHDRLVSALNGDEILADHGQRVCMVYPMRSEDDSRVSMRLKRAQPSTGQLRYDWVTVYDPNKERRFLQDFSLIP